ncbi:MAG: GNAT family N-acetyltransferase [Chlorobiaceae bacterium]
MIPYDARCLELSWLWLNDPEIRELTMTPIFTREDQNIYFKNLPLRLDYKIWGILLDGHEIVGAAGLKNYRGSLAEYWGYIGEKKYLNQGLGQSLVKVVEEKARNSGIIDLDLKVFANNIRAIKLYQKVGFLIDHYNSTDSYLRMLKQGIQ